MPPFARTLSVAALALVQLVVPLVAAGVAVDDGRYRVTTPEYVSWGPTILDEEVGATVRNRNPEPATTIAWQTEEDPHSLVASARGCETPTPGGGICPIRFRFTPLQLPGEHEFVGRVIAVNATATWVSPPVALRVKYCVLPPC